MKRGMLSILILLLFASCNNRQNASSNENYNKIINNIRRKFVPDARDHIFEIKPEEKNGQLILNGTSDYPEALKALQNQLKENHISFENQIKILPEDSFKNKMGITRLSVANLRSRPEHTAELVTQTLMGMPLHILESKNDFYRVKTPVGYYAWVDAAGICIMNQEEFQAWLAKNKIIITTNCGQVYEKPNPNAPIICDMVVNDVFARLGEEKKFIKILLPDKRIGYVSKEDAIYLEEFDGTNQRYATSLDIVIFAKQFLGVPYLWGGTSFKGLDCSGFTKTIYAQLGYLLPRDASQQAKVGKEIKLDDNFSQLQSGDLLFFGKKKNGKQKITHVAIYIDDGKIVHATGEVKIESLNPEDEDYNPDRKKTLLQARRMIGQMPLDFSKIYKNK